MVACQGNWFRKSPMFLQYSQPYDGVKVLVIRGWAGFRPPRAVPFSWPFHSFFFLFFFLIQGRLFYLFIYFYIYFWLCWVLVSVRGLPLVAASGGHSSSRCAGLFTIAASLVAEHRLQTHRLSSCGSRSQLLRGMWDPPRPGLEPVSPALAGRFSTTAPPGKPWALHLLRG